MQFDLAKKVSTRPDLFIGRHLPSVDFTKNLDISHKVDHRKTATKKIPLKELQDFADLTTRSKDTNVLKLASIPELSSHENKVLEECRDIASKNIVCKNLIGEGFHPTWLPSVIKNGILQNPAFYTAYTPYQAEISQGRLTLLFLYQTLITELTGCEVANASLLDEGSACLEALRMCSAKASAKNMEVLLTNGLHPPNTDILSYNAPMLGIEPVVVDYKQTIKRIARKKDNICGVFVQYPDTTGVVQDFKTLGQLCKEYKIPLVFVADPLSLMLLKSPAELGASIVVGSTQRFGTQMAFGGPHAGFIGVKKSDVRHLPGRIVGATTDKSGTSALRLALQTREQHIRRDKATSNICTAQALPAMINVLYAMYHGKEGMRFLAERIHKQAHNFAQRIKTLGFDLVEDKCIFDTVVVKLPICGKTNEILDQFAKKGFNVRHMGDHHIGVSFSEKFCEDKDTNDLCHLFEELFPYGIQPHPELYEENNFIEDVSLPVHLLRSSEDYDSLLNNIYFLNYTNEVEMTRFIRRLAKKDISLADSMIPLGSCTMKLNSVSSLEPVADPNLTEIHPYAPEDQVQGWMKIVEDLSAFLGELTDLPGVSLQPKSGATAEHAGLVAFRQAAKAKGKSDRNVVIIPSSAHGTNASSAHLAGLKPIQVRTNIEGEIDLEELKLLLEKHGKHLLGIMVTYPSTYGRFDKNIKEVTDLIHLHDGYVYLDGANFNALVTAVSLKVIGADCCHLNLHKTFGIPHGGGGPGVGALCVTKELSQFLPQSRWLDEQKLQNTKGFPTGSSAFGNAGVLPVSWMFIKMLGIEGLVLMRNAAIWNSQYMKNKLKPHGFDIKFEAGTDDLCGHEFVVDCAPFKKEAGISEVDIAKRLMDFGFHAPTVSFPIKGSLMIEPTESESIEEMDRFCEALIQIKKEITKIANGIWTKEDNPIVNAPHTEKEVTAELWNHLYSRQDAAFPLDWIVTRGKYWPPVGRVADSFGDKNLKLSLKDLTSDNLFT
eukprot:GHVP01047121.1.p1 GENE.GHVP01047121.1~~GHVP01047121.1.p1  ORF type:complete len:999 (-),score=195.63 GHVP01047121.1:901-3897(-)